MARMAAIRKFRHFADSRCNITCGPVSHAGTAMETMMQLPWRDRRGQFLWLKALVLPALFVPGLLYAFWLATDQLGARPVIEAIHGHLGLTRQPSGEIAVPRIGQQMHEERPLLAR